MKEKNEVEGYDFESVVYLDPTGKTGYPLKKYFSSYQEYLNVINTFIEKRGSEMNDLWRSFVDGQVEETNQKIKFEEFLNDESRHITVHPALTILENLLFICFSERKLNKNYKSDLVKSKGSKGSIPERWINEILCLTSEVQEDGSYKITLIQSDEITIKDKKYYLEPNSSSKSRRLPDVNYFWNKKMLYQAISNSFADGNLLYTNMINKAKKHIKFENEEDYHLLISWIVATYFHPTFNAFPYLHFKAMKGSGKTTALSFLRLLAFNASKEIATFPAMRDKIDTYKATFIVDQADTKLGTRNDTDTSILDAFVDSYKKATSKISKMVTVGKNFEPVEFEAYSPKAFASIKELHTDLKDRCIQITLIRSKDNLDYLEEEDGFWLVNKDLIYKLLLTKHSEVREYYKKLTQKYKVSNEIIGRSLELWLPIETIMNLCKIDENIVNKVKQNFINRNKNSESTLSSADWSVIDVILKLMDGFEERYIATKEIATLVEFENFDEDENVRIDKKSQYVGNIIKRLNLFTSKKHDRDGNYWLFTKIKVEEIRDSYSGEEKSSVPFTTEKDLKF